MPTISEQALAALKHQMAHEGPAVAGSSSPTEKKGHLFPLTVLAMMGGAGADVYSTEKALSSNPNAYETNPLMRGGTGARIGIKAATTGAEAFLLSKLAHNHPKLANGLGIGIGAIQAGVAYKNMQKVKK